MIRIFFFITSWNLVKKPPLVIGHTEGKAFICSLCASCMICKLYFLCSIFRVAIKFPFGGQYEYAKTNKTAISSLVRLFFFHPPPRKFQAYMPSTCTLGWWEISSSNFEKFFKTFANLEHSTSGTSVDIFRMMLTNASLNSWILAE